MTAFFDNLEATDFTIVHRGVPSVEVLIRRDGIPIPRFEQQEFPRMASSRVDYAVSLSPQQHNQSRVVRKIRLKYPAGGDYFVVAYMPPMGFASLFSQSNGKAISFRLNAEVVRSNNNENPCQRELKEEFIGLECTPSWAVAKNNSATGGVNNNNDNHIRRGVVECVRKDQSDSDNDSQAKEEGVNVHADSTSLEGRGVDESVGQVAVLPSDVCNTKYPKNCEKVVVSEEKSERFAADDDDHNNSDGRSNKGLMASSVSMLSGDLPARKFRADKHYVPIDAAHFVVTVTFDFEYNNTKINTSKNASEEGSPTGNSGWFLLRGAQENLPGYSSFNFLRETHFETNNCTVIDIGKGGDQKGGVGMSKGKAQCSWTQPNPGNGLWWFFTVTPVVKIGGNASCAEMSSDAGGTAKKTICIAGNETSNVTIDENSLLYSVSFVSFQDEGDAQESIVMFNSFVYRSPLDFTYTFSDVAPASVSGELKQSQNFLSPANESAKMRRFLVKTLAFDLSPADVGGVLSLTASANYLPNPGQTPPGGKSVFSQLDPVNITILAKCGSIPQMATAGGYDLKFNGLSNAKSIAVQFPSAGRWFVLFLVNEPSSAGKAVPSTSLIDINMTYDISAVVSQCPNKCNGRGDCKMSYSDHGAFYAFCDCWRPFQGWDCGELLRSTLSTYLRIILLVLSNTAFVPGILLAQKMRLWSEQFVYFYAMIASSVYHVCDEDLRFCVLGGFEPMKYLDFTGAFASIWVTFVHLSGVRGHGKHVAHLAGILLFGLIADTDSSALWAMAAPFVGGMAYVAVTFWKQHRSFRKAFAESRTRVFQRFLSGFLRWGYFFGGIGLVIVGISVFLVYETDENYGFTHSIWHVSVALSIGLFLKAGDPGRKRYKKWGGGGGAAFRSLSTNPVSHHRRFSDLVEDEEEDESSNDASLLGGGSRRHSSGVEDAEEYSADYQLEGYGSDDIEACNSSGTLNLSGIGPERLPGGSHGRDPTNRTEAPENFVVDDYNYPLIGNGRGGGILQFRSPEAVRYSFSNKDSVNGNLANPDASGHEQRTMQIQKPPSAITSVAGNHTTDAQENSEITAHPTETPVERDDDNGPSNDGKSNEQSEYVH
eukprot:Nk52_evm22s24 gene=Nk52_evmTU22s24